MKQAFSLLELLFILLIIALFFFVNPLSQEPKSLGLAAKQLLYDLEYTRHLALLDNHYDPTNPIWFKNRWQLQFTRSVQNQEIWTYSIYSDSFNQDGRVNISDTLAINPYEREKLLSGGQSPSINLDDERRSGLLSFGEEFAITNVFFSSSCSTGSGVNQSRRILFDYYGRPYYTYTKKDNGVNPYADMKLIESQCQVTLSTNKESIKICIEAEIGFIHLCE